MTRLRSLRVLVLALAPIAVLLAFASGAAAETWSGETTTVEATEGHPSPEVTLLTASASYDPIAGNVSFDIVTGAEPASNQGFAGAVAGLIRTPGACNVPTVRAYNEEGPPLGTSLLSFESPYSQPFFAFGTLERLPEPVEVPVTKVVSGSATTLSAASSLLTNQGYNCAFAEAFNSAGGTAMTFPLVLQPSAPPAPPAPAPAPPASPSPAPAPPALSIAKAKPFKLKAGKARSVKITVTNTGATAAAQGSLKVKSTKGILVTPEVQKLPPLAPGASWSVYVRLKPTAKAKAKSTLSLAASASGVTGKGSLAIKVEG
jgi:hypothetical protein